ncbi:hypothetical protein PGT21_010114 [Puccinia graminis f. sp. tritici]|uniref:Uncharacterized protein n=1 Tax=Puccinia graminis f. sp. tritici TaxID=56615 RepID=A0A5B0PKM2_PUCGR|nr:hypothetical protein PGT21_010114 [Puccinia graminis f. sp. tritici]
MNDQYPLEYPAPGQDSFHPPQQLHSNSFERLYEDPQTDQYQVPPPYPRTRVTALQGSIGTNLPIRELSSSFQTSLQSGGFQHSSTTGHQHRLPTTGHQDQSTGIQLPATGHQDRSTSFQHPSTGHQDRSTGYQHPSTGHHDQSTGFHHPSTGHHNQSTGFQHPSTGHHDQSTGFQHPSTGHQDQSTGLQHPSTGHHDQSTGFQHPSTGHHDRSTGFQQPSTGHQDQSTHPSTGQHDRLTGIQHPSSVSVHHDQSTGHQVPDSHLNTPTSIAPNSGDRLSNPQSASPAASPLLANGGVRTRRPKRTAEQMRLAEIVAAAKHARKLQHQADKAADARQKQTATAANRLLKAQKAAQTAPRPTWTEEQTIELFNYVRMVKDDHSQTRVTGGFIPFGKYFAAYTAHAEAFPLLALVPTAARLAKYRTVMDKWKQKTRLTDPGQVGYRRHCSGRTCHKRYATQILWSEVLRTDPHDYQLWDLILDMHGGNPAATGEGLTSSYAEYESLLVEAQPSGSSDEGDSSDIEGLDSLPARPWTPIGQQTKYQRLCAGLTPAKLALDADLGSDSDLPDAHVLAAPQAAPSAAAAPPVATPGPASTPTGSRRSAKAKDKVSAIKLPVSRPPAEGGSVARRRGRTEDKPKEDDPAAAGMLVMMHKAQESSATWAMEERSAALAEHVRQDTLRAEERADRLRLEDQRADERADERLAADRRAEAMELARRDEVRQANKDRELLRIQAKLDRELADHQMKMEREAARERADQAAEDRKQERVRAKQQQRSHQLFEMAMLRAMGMAINIPQDPSAPGGSGSNGQ